MLLSKLKDLCAAAAAAAAAVSDHPEHTDDNGDFLME